MYKRRLVFLLSAFSFFSLPFPTTTRLHLNRMSWDGYIDTMMAKDSKGNPILIHSCIIGFETMSVWATSPGFVVTPSQIKILLGDPSSFAQTGPTIGPYKCRFLRDNKCTDGLWCIDFKTTADAEGNSYNMCVGYSLKAMIIGVGAKETSGGKVSDQVFKITSYLRQNQM